MTKKSGAEGVWEATEGAGVGWGIVFGKKRRNV